MYKMIEVVGQSPESYSEAVKDAVNKVATSNEKASWFEIVEQRGAIRDGKLKEFQVKVKVALSA